MILLVVCSTILSGSMKCGITPPWAVRKSERQEVTNLLCQRMNACAILSPSRHDSMVLMCGTRTSDDTQSRTLSRFLILWTTSSIVCEGDGTERTISMLWLTVCPMTMHGGQTGFTRGFLRWWHNGWAWIVHMVTVWHRYSSHDRAIGSLPSVNVCCPKRYSGAIMTTLSSVRSRIRCGQ